MQFLLLYICENKRQNFDLSTICTAVYHNERVQKYSRIYHLGVINAFSGNKKQH